jgi:hypothetical protein
MEEADKTGEIDRQTNKEIDEQTEKPPPLLRRPAGLSLRLTPRGTHTKNRVSALSAVCPLIAGSALTAVSAPSAPMPPRWTLLAPDPSGPIFSFYDAHDLVLPALLLYFAFSLVSPHILIHTYHHILI